jgi:hypothetical protein
MRTLKPGILILLVCLAVTFAGCAGSAEFEVSTLAVSPDTTLDGQGTTVTALVTNTSASEGSYTAVLNYNGESAETKTITVPANSTAEVRFTVEGLSLGTHTISIGDSQGTLTVLGLDDLLRKSQQAMSQVESYHMTIDIEMTMDPSMSLTLDEGEE